MNDTLEKKVAYERLENGADVYILRTSTKDLTVASVAIPVGDAGGHREKNMTLALCELLFPLGTKRMKKAFVEDYFESRGADISLQVGKEFVTVTLSTCTRVFPEAFSFLMEVLTGPRVTHKDFSSAHERLTNKLRHAKESTRTQASIALAQAQFLKGHPEWIDATETSQTELKHVSCEDVARVYAAWPKGVGTVAVIVSDASTNDMMRVTCDALARLPQGRVGDGVGYDVQRRAPSIVRDVVVPLTGKRNIDTVFGVPLSITNTDSRFLPLLVGVRILGGPASSRIYTSLRTKQGLTYGGYAELRGFSKRYTGSLKGMVIFPDTVFQKGREALRNELEHFIEKGVTAHELALLKEELRGSFTIGLSSTAGLHRALFTTLVQGRSISYLDTYVEAVLALRARDVNLAIRSHVDPQALTIVGAGAVDDTGAPLAL